MSKTTPGIPRLPPDATIVVTDGQKLRLFRNTGDGAQVALTELPRPDVHGDEEGAGRHQHTGPDNADDRRMQDRRLDKDHQEASFGAAVAKWLNHEIAAGRMGALFVIAPPRALGDLRLHYGDALKQQLLGELAKEHTQDSAHALEKVLQGG
jgi:protein required for attachment to host cells